MEACSVVSVVLTFNSMEETLWCDYSTAVNLFGGAFAVPFVFNISHNEIWDFSCILIMNMNI